MCYFRNYLLFSLLALTSFLCLSAEEADLVPKTWDVDGVERKAMIYTPVNATQKSTPVIFAFHGHGGTMRHAARTFAYQKHWPEALVVYMQGLPTPGKTDPDGKLPGWQKTAGDQNDRDLKFFDAVLADLRANYKVDEKRIYVTGHSNGGGFTYLLWSARGDVFAAVAPAAGGLGLRNLAALKPKPALHVAGEKDEVVSFENQKRTMAAVRKLNNCEFEGQEWANSGSLIGTLYLSKTATPFVSLIYPGDHKFPSEAPGLIVQFFKEYIKD